jgi:predicted DNA-binding protein with PD1-like motif
MVDWHVVTTNRIQRGRKGVCEKERVCLGNTSGIRAVDHAVVGLCHVADRKHEWNPVDGEMEAASLPGNAVEKVGQVDLHLHAALARAEGQVVGGHLNETRVSGTAEICVNTARTSIGRRGTRGAVLNVFDLPSRTYLPLVSVLCPRSSQGHGAEEE